jgi:hypothetical protein
MQASLREEVERDVTQLKTALRQYNDQVQRLECQKQLLLKQVYALKIGMQSPRTTLTVC